MNILTHSEPHKNCRGCQMMEEVRRDIRLLKEPLEISLDTHPDGRIFEDEDYPTPSDMKTLELRSLLKEVLQAPIIAPHFSPHKGAVLLDDELVARIAKALDRTR